MVNNHCLRKNYILTNRLKGYSFGKGMSLYEEMIFLAKCYCKDSNEKLTQSDYYNLQNIFYVLGIPNFETKNYGNERVKLANSLVNKVKSNNTILKQLIEQLLEVNRTYKKWGDKHLCQK